MILENHVETISSQINTLERQLAVLRAERAAYILEMRKSGASLDTIGKVSSLSRQGVLCIIRKYEVKDAAQ